MLNGFGYPVDTRDGVISLEGGALSATDIDIPADISSAAFFLVGASIAPGSDLTLEHVGINPTRDGVWIRILRAMGADIEIMNERLVGGEPVADLRVRHAPLNGIEIPEEEVPLAIDELPVVLIAAACAEGVTVLRGAEELRVKESDRIASMAEGLSQLGIRNKPRPDGIEVTGGEMSGGVIATHFDHRIAMSFSIAALRASSLLSVSSTAKQTASVAPPSGRRSTSVISR